MQEAKAANKMPRHTAIVAHVSGTGRVFPLAPSPRFRFKIILDTRYIEYFAHSTQRAPLSFDYMQVVR